MAQFRATIQGARGGASRLGHKSTGVTATVNGWSLGALVEMDHLTTLGASGDDVVHLYVTNGSAHGVREHVASFRRINGGFVRCTTLGDPIPEGA